MFVNRKISDIKEMIKNKKVRFQYFRDGEFWYSTECGFNFPVPLSEVGTATLLNEDKAILFMRYIRKYIHLIEDAKNEASMGNTKSCS